MILRIAHEAEEELTIAAEWWYEQRRVGLGIELVAEFDRVIQEVVNLPLACPLWREDRPYRKKSLRRFPHVIFFRVEGETVRVDAVAHVRRRPGYWLERPER